MVTELISDEIARRGVGAQTRLAEAVDVAVQTVNKWVKGETTPDPARLSAIERALDMEPGTLLAAAGITGAPAGSILDRLARLEAQQEEIAALVSELRSELRARPAARKPSRRDRPDSP